MNQREPYTIKQMMPLPEGYEVMMEVTHQNGAKEIGRASCRERV